VGPPIPFKNPRSEFLRLYEILKLDAAFVHTFRIQIRFRICQKYHYVTKRCTVTFCNIIVFLSIAHNYLTESPIHTWNVQTSQNVDFAGVYEYMPLAKAQGHQHLGITSKLYLIINQYPAHARKSLKIKKSPEVEDLSLWIGRPNNLNFCGICRHVLSKCIRRLCSTDCIYIHSVGPDEPFNYLPT
jgi:hypothetical protein